MSTRKKIVFTLIALVLSVGVLELSSFLIFKFGTGYIIARAPNSETMLRRFWYFRHRPGHTDPPIALYDRVLGWRSVPDFRNSAPLFHSAVVSTNSLGARGRVDIPYERTDKRRIVVIGDSFAFGWGVSDSETYADLVSERLAQTEIVNLGIGGFGTDQMLLMLQKEGLRYAPDLVVVGIINDDTFRNVLSFRDSAKPWYRLESGKLLLTGVPVPTIEAVYGAQERRTNLIDLAGLMIDIVNAGWGDQQRNALALTRRLWEEIRRVSHEAGAKTLFVYAPDGPEIAAGSTVTHVLFLNFAAEHPGETVDATPEFRRRLQAGERMKMTGHWDATGHQIVAATIEQAIQERNLLPVARAEQ